MRRPAVRALRLASSLPGTAQLRSHSVLLPLAPSSKSSICSALLHNRPDRRLQSSSEDGRKSESTQNVEEYPALSFEALGLSKNMKMVVLGILGIFGTIETWFWCKAIWRWWTNKGDTEEDDPKVAK